MKHKDTSVIDKTIVRDALVRVADEYYNSKYHKSIIDKSRVELISSLLYLLQNQGKRLKALSILDVGCGKCDLLLLLKELGSKELLGVNLFPLNKEVFKINVDSVFGDEPGQIKYVELDVDKEPLPFALGSFDCVLLIDVMEHLYDPAFALKEISRVLKHDGFLVIKTPNGANLAKRLRPLFGKSSYHDVKGWFFDHRFLVPKTRERKFQGHIREYTLEELKWILKTVNLKLLLVRFYQVERASNTPKLLLKIYNALEFLYPRFAYHIGIIGAKTEAV